MSPPPRPRIHGAPFLASSILQSDDRPLLVCFSHLRWDFVWQRPQHLLSRAAADFHVLFIEEPVFRRPARPLIETRREPGGVTVAVPVLPDGVDAATEAQLLTGLVADLLARAPGGPRVFWYYTPMAMAFSTALDCDLCIYDNMDELSAFRGASPEMLVRERALLARADLVFTGGMSLYEAKRHRHPSVHALPSSIDVAHFAAARQRLAPEPADQAPIPRPRLGFFGVIDERMDADLVAAVAALRPAWQIVMIGPVVKIEESSLPRRPNIHWLGPKTYAELPRYLAGWDVGLMPFALNEATRFISPTKTPEYLAAGVPVVCTPIADVVRSYGDKRLVAIAAGAEAVVAAAEGWLGEPEAGWLERVDRHLAGGSWDKTWAAMHRLIQAGLDRRVVPAAAVAAVRMAAPAE